MKTQLAHGLEISIPRSWVVVGGSQLSLTETAVGAIVDLSGLAKMLDGAETLLVANNNDPETFLGIAITSLAVRGVNATTASSFTDAELQAGERQLKLALENSFGKLSERTTDWTPMRKIRIGSNVVTHISYVRVTEGKPTRVTMYKFFGKGRIFDVALSTRLSQQQLAQPIFERILDSVRIRS